MTKIITRDIPHVCTVSEKALTFANRFRLEKVYKVSPGNFVIVDDKIECILLNKDLENVAEIKDLIFKIMESKYLPEKLFDKFLALTDKNSEKILLKIYSDWRNARNKRDLHNQALSLLKSAKSLRIHWLVKRNKEIIKELYEIGFGIYDEKATCNSQQGAENAFMYGYLLGTQANSK